MDPFELLNLWRRQAALATGYAAMAPFAGFVVANRLGSMVAEAGSPTARGAQENYRMITEKLTASVEATFAAGQVLGGLATAAGPVAAAGLMVAAGEAALAPVNRAVRANARRLAKRR